MKKLFISSFLLAVSIFSFAQQRDPKAKALLDAVSAKFKTYKTVTAKFAYEIQNSAGKALAKKTGTVNMKGEKYSINFGANKIISDGQTVWNYDPASKEVTVNEASKSSGTITPQKLFTNFYDDDFNYAMAGEDKIGGRAVQKVILQPVDTKKPFSRVYLSIDKITRNLVSVFVAEKSGNRYIYSISNLKSNVPLTDGMFSFNKAAYPGVEVVDLR